MPRCAAPEPERNFQKQLLEYNLSLQARQHGSTEYKLRREAIFTVRIFLHMCIQASWIVIHCSHFSRQKKAQRQPRRFHCLF